jgi:hypothetical protein
MGRLNAPAFFRTHSVSSAAGCSDVVLMNESWGLVCEERNCMCCFRGAILPKSGSDLGPISWPKNPLKDRERAVSTVKIQ